MRKGRGWRNAGLVALALIALAAIATPLVLSLPQFGGEVAGERLARARADPHYRDTSSAGACRRSGCASSRGDKRSRSAA